MGLDMYLEKRRANNEEYEDSNYSEELLKMLINNDIQCELPHIENIYVR